MSVGIDAIAFSVPQFYLDMEELAKIRGVDPLKFTKGLGQREMAVATPCEDSVVLAVNAARNLVAHFEVNPDEIGLVIVGTETSVDQSKPISVYVHEQLQLSPNCRAFETKHACYGAMAGVAMATDWILSGRANGKKALIIATDIARYGAHTPGEPTQGAGAVAMLIDKNPRLLEFEVEKQGYYSKQVMDFWRPNYSKEAFADGHYSIQCYLESLAGAYNMYRETAGREELSACLYHSPFVKMAQKAHVRLVELQGENDFAEKSPELAAAVRDYANRVAPYLEINARVGNIYTGSLFLSLINLLEDGLPTGASPRISLFSYGSGCMAEFWTGLVMPEAQRWMKRHPFRQSLDQRAKLSIPQYENILEAAGQADKEGSEEICNPSRWGIHDGFLYLGNRNHQRIYQNLLSTSSTKPLAALSAP